MISSLLLPPPPGLGPLYLPKNPNGAQGQCERRRRSQGSTLGLCEVVVVSANPPASPMAAALGDAKPPRLD